MRHIDRSLNIADLRKRAARRMPRPVFDFLDGGADDERTIERNRKSFADYRLLPGVMRDVSAIDTSVSVLGQKLAWPWITAPTGMPALFHPAGEQAIARATAASGGLYCLSTMASQSIEEVAAGCPGAKAFQLYLFRDRAISAELIERARAAEYKALILAVDIPVPANRERDRRTGMTIPPAFGLRSLLDLALRPAWCWHALRRPMRLANFTDHRAAPGSTLLEFINSQFDPALGWKDLEWVRARWDGPLAIKGVLRPDDAVHAVERGADAVILSNHGGRQLDSAAAPLDMLRMVLQRLDGRAEVIVDGGIRRGTDMLKAMALGATACMAGRPLLYGLAAHGPVGATRALDLLRAEYDRGMKMLGATLREEIDGNCIVAVNRPS